MKTGRKTFYPFFVYAAVIFLPGCEKDEPGNNTIVYTEDGRTVKHGDLSPIALDVTGDGRVDFTIFVELTANSQGDRLYAGVNPTGANLIKSGPPIDENFLSMGFLVAESPGSVIDEGLKADQLWTSDFGALVIRNTFINGDITHEGNWANESQIVGIQNRGDGFTHYGWLRIEFDKDTEIVTLVDYAYESISNRPINAGQTSQ